MMNRLLVQQQQRQQQQRQHQARFAQAQAQFIDDNDDRQYDEVNAQVIRYQDESVRTITEELMNKLRLQPLEGPDAKAILDEFKCSICQDLVNEPMVIKHCLHFFCKNCIDKNVLNFRKECPLCKIQLRTKRETRFYDKLRKIMGLMKKEIGKNRDGQGEKYLEALDLWKEKKEKQVEDLERRRSQNSSQHPDSSSFNASSSQQQTTSQSNERTSLKSKNLDKSVSKSKIIAEVDVSDEEDSCIEGFQSQMDRLGDGDMFEDEDELRIREAAERLKLNQQKLKKQKDLQERAKNAWANGKVVSKDQNKQIVVQNGHTSMAPPHPLSIDELLQRDFSRLYHKLKDQEQSNPTQLKLPKQLQPMDLNIKIIFDEDLKSMVFPKVQEIEFRVSRRSPFEMAAKLLATQNGHMSEWSKYEFAFCRSTMSGKDRQGMSSHEIEIKDWRSKTFGEAVHTTRLGLDDSQNFTLFYKINGLAEILQAQSAAIQQAQNQAVQQAQI